MVHLAENESSGAPSRGPALAKRSTSWRIKLKVMGSNLSATEKIVHMATLAGCQIEPGNKRIKQMK